VHAREHLGAGRQSHAAVHEPEAHRRGVGERDLAWSAAQVAGRFGAHAALQLVLSLVEVADRIGVERVAVSRDRRTDDGRMRCEHEPGEVMHVRAERELATHGVPVVGCHGPGRRGRAGRADAAADQRRRAGRETRAREQLAPRQRHRAGTLRRRGLTAR
jgi:hypothetical protein